MSPMNHSERTGLPSQGGGFKRSSSERATRQCVSMSFHTIYLSLIIRPESPRQSPLKDTVLRSDTSVPPAGSPPPSYEPIPFPSRRVEPIPPSDIPNHSSASLPPIPAPSDDYSWEWGGFPQRSPIGMQYPAPAPLKILDGTPADDLATASKPDEFHRSKSLPPEFELDFSDGPPSTSPPEAEQLRGLEPLSDVETDYGHGPSSPSQEEYKSWVRWWRRDRRLPGGVDIRVERPPSKHAATTPLPSVSCVL